LFKSKKKIVEIENHDDFLDICSEKAKSCFLAILNGDPA